MDANEIIEAIRTAKKKTPVKVYIKASRPLHFENCHVFTGTDTVVIGDYEDIAGGFRKKFLGLCFITTAVCRELGKPDDCPELTAFRAFRDGYLAAQPDGPALIREYYRIAPAIVTCIDLCTEHTVRYRQLREKYLSPCYDDLLHGRQAQCKRRDVRMVRALEREFLGREHQ